MKRKIDELEMLAWIEGETGDLPPERARAIAEAVDADPELKSWLAAAAADRAMLARWGEAASAQAPPDLFEDAIALAERRALLGADATPTSSSLSRSIAISVAQMGSPRAKPWVPSMGSMYQVRRPSPSTEPPSSATNRP